MQKKEEKKTNTQEKAVSIDTFEMVDRLVQNAQQALKEYMELDQEQVDKIVHAMTLAGLDKHMLLAKMAYEETGRGVMEDKVIKNIFSTEYIWHSIKKQKTVGRKVGLGLYAVVPHRDAQFIFFPAEFGQFDPVKTAEVRVVRTAGKSGNLSVDPHGIVAVCGNPQKNPSGSFCPETALEIHIADIGVRQVAGIVFRRVAVIPLGIHPCAAHHAAHTER